MSDNKITIDFLEQIEIDKSKYKSQAEMLLHLRSGLEELYVKCKSVENKVRQENLRFVQAQRQSLLFFVSLEFYNALPCYFHWFSVSLVNYVRLVGYLKGIHSGEIVYKNSQLTNDDRKKIRSICSEYVSSISEIEHVEIYRNKIAAHFAVTDPRPDDNFVTMNFSAINLAGLADSRLVTKAEKNLAQDDEGRLVADNIPIWSLTKIFEDLSSRFWPDHIIPTALSGESFFEKDQRENPGNVFLQKEN